MNTDKRIARITGILFILATVAGILSVAFSASILTEPLNLVNVSENENRVMVGTLFYFIMAVAVAGIAIAIYPILKKHNEALALGYIGARIVEGILFIVSIIATITLLTLSQEFVEAGTPHAPHYQTLGALLLAAGDWAYYLGFGFFFTVSAFILNYLLYQSKLIPRWLSVWGLVGAVLVFAYYLLEFFSISNLTGILFLPIALQEMVFAIWLIVKGFYSSAIASQST